MKAIETTWHGIKFRSKLEARWAVVFESLGIDWEYEPEGFVLDDGTCYLPDFLLHGVVGRNGCNPKEWWDKFGLDAYAEGRCDATNGDLYVEVKGRWTEGDRRKVWEFARYRPIYCVGNIPQGNRIDDAFKGIEQKADKNISSKFNFVTVDGTYGGAVLGVNYYGEVELFDDPTNRFSDCWRAANEMAYGIASKPRFDHGDVPDEVRVDQCRSMIADARVAYGAVCEDVNKLLGQLTEDDVEYLRSVTKRLTDIKKRLGIINIRVEAHDDLTDESCVEFLTINGIENLYGSDWYRVARSNECGELVFATQGEHKSKYNGAKCAATAELDANLDIYDDAPLIKRTRSYVENHAFMANVDR